jgi:hypothetical protein
MIYVCVRETTEWDNEAVFRAQLREDFGPRVALWNAVFEMPYHLFRHRIKAIAQLNLSRVEHVRHATLDAVPDGSLVVPVDDDDWLAPDLGRALAVACEGGKTGYYWQKLFLEPPPPFPQRLAATLPGFPRRKSALWTCSTNNYALVKSAATLPLLANHVVASEYFDRAADQVKWVDGRLSVMNRTLASQTSLGFKRPMITRDELIAKFHRYRRLYARTARLPAPWCRPYVQMMDELMAELRLR